MARRSKLPRAPKGREPVAGRLYMSKTGQPMVATGKSGFGKYKFLKKSEVKKVFYI